MPASLVAAFAAAVIASPVAAVADETEVQNNLARAESASSPGSMQGSEELTPGWNQADTCEWRIDDGTLTLRPLGNGDSGELYSKPSWGSDFTHFAIEGKVTLSSNGYSGWSGSSSVLFSSCPNLESVDLRGLRFEDNYINDFSGFFKTGWGEDLPALRSITIDSSFAYRCYGNKVKSPEFPGENKFSRWVSSVDGIAYECDGYPSGVAATYTLQSSADVKNAWNQSESCLWKLDGNGLLTIKPQNGSEGVLSYDIGRDDDSSSWLAFSSDIKSVAVKGTVKPHSNESWGDNSGPLFRNCSNLKTADLSGISTDNGNAPIDSNTFEGCSSLQSVTLGSAFVLAEGFAPWFPQNGATYRWISSVDGVAYECNGYPSGVAATYTLQDKGDVIGSWSQSGTCL